MVASALINNHKYCRRGLTSVGSWFPHMVVSARPSPRRLVTCVLEIRAMTLASQEDLEHHRKALNEEVEWPF